MESGWTKVGSNKRKQKKYRPPMVEKFSTNESDKKLSHECSNLLKRISENKYIFKYLNGKYKNSRGNSLFNDPSFKLARRYHRSMAVDLGKCTKVLERNVRNMQEPKLVELSISKIERIVERIQLDLPQHLWQKEFYLGNVYNSEGVKCCELTENLKTLAKDFVEKLPEEERIVEKKEVTESPKPKISEKADFSKKSFLSLFSN